MLTFVGGVVFGKGVNVNNRCLLWMAASCDSHYLDICGVAGQAT